MDREIELKLECEPEALDRLRRARALTSLTKGRASARKLRSVYFDTEDFALMNSGFALRVRQTGATRVQTLKTEPEGGGPASDRGEWEVSLGAGDDGPDLNRLPAALRDRIRTLAHGGQISPRLVSDIRRTTNLLHMPDGGRIELAIDRGVLRANGHEAQVSELELELKRGEPAELYRLALALTDVAPLRIGLRSKAERARALAGGENLQPVRSEAVALSRDASVGDAYALILRHCLTHLLANEAAAFEGNSAEALHQMRVALRRMRSAFLAFDGLAGGGTDDMTREAKWLTRAIGGARDHDVFLKEILAPAIAHDEGDAELAALQVAAEKARDEAWAAARACIRSPRMTRFVLQMALYLDEEGWRGETAGDISGKPVAGFAAAALDKRLKKTMKLARNIDHLDADDRHELRKRLKKLRYTLGFFAALFPRAHAGRYLRQLAKLQDVFGALNDVETAQEIVEALGRANPGLADAGARAITHHERRVRKERQAARRLCRHFATLEPFWR